jgi:hypothetical protein
MRDPQSQGPGVPGARSTCGTSARSKFNRDSRFFALLGSAPQELNTVRPGANCEISAGTEGATTRGTALGRVPCTRTQRTNLHLRFAEGAAAVAAAGWALGAPTRWSTSAIQLLQSAPRVRYSHADTLPGNCCAVADCALAAPWGPGPLRFFVYKFGCVSGSPSGATNAVEIFAEGTAHTTTNWGLQSGPRGGCSPSPFPWSALRAAMAAGGWGARFPCGGAPPPRRVGSSGPGKYVLLSKIPRSKWRKQQQHHHHAATHAGAGSELSETGSVQCSCKTKLRADGQAEVQPLEQWRRERSGDEHGEGGRRE